MKKISEAIDVIFSGSDYDPKTGLPRVQGRLSDLPAQLRLDLMAGIDIAMESWDLRIASTEFQTNFNRILLWAGHHSGHSLSNASQLLSGTNPYDPNSKYEWERVQSQNSTHVPEADAKHKAIGTTDGGKFLASKEADVQFINNLKDEIDARVKAFEASVTGSGLYCCIISPMTH